MKVLLLGLLLVGAYAAEWDLADVSSNNDWTKAAAAVGGSNQGYKARYTSQGKLLKLSLAVHKEKNVRVTDTDRLLFGMEAPQSHIRRMENTTVPRADSEELCKRALGDKWAEMVTLPEEDLSYIESLRLAASLNEYNLLKAGSPIRKNTRSSYGYHESESHEASFPSDFDCICHSTSHRFPWANPMADAHDTPFWGIRLLQRYTRHTDPGHSVHGIPNCILCDHTQIGNAADEANGFDFDCRWCCSGECVIGTGGETLNTGIGGGWFDCDFAFQFDDFRADMANDITFNYFRINDVGECRLPRIYDCITEVNRWCENCDNFLQEIVPDSDSDSDFLEELEACSYCDLVVGANPFICNNCSHALQNIQDFQDNFRGTTTGGCSCENAMFQVSQNERYHHEGDNHHEDSYEHEGHYESYDYDYRGYDYRGYESHEGDHYEGDHYESHDYRPADYNYDYRGYESHEGDHYESHDYRQSDYDYRPRDYDYRPADYDYDYRGYDYRGYESHEGDHYEGDHYESHDYRPSDYDYRPRDYDYRGDGYESHDYRPSDYDYRPRDYDYRGYDYDYRG